MNTKATLTQRTLQQEFGWSRYLTRTICQGLDFMWLKGVKQYAADDLQAAISIRLNRPRLQQKNKNILTNTLNRLEGRSNLIEVDFLRKLSPRERTTFWMAQREQAITEGQQVIDEIHHLVDEIKRTGLA